MAPARRKVNPPAAIDPDKHETVKELRAILHGHESTPAVDLGRRDRKTRSRSIREDLGARSRGLSRYPPGGGRPTTWKTGNSRKPLFEQLDGAWGHQRTGGGAMVPVQRLYPSHRYRTWTGVCRLIATRGLTTAAE